MMSPLTTRASMMALTLLLAGPGAPGAQVIEPPSHSPEAPLSRVRPLDNAARNLMDRAVAASPTVARMIAELQATDLVVSVQTCRLPKLLNGDARAVRTVPSVVGPRPSPTSSA